MRTKSWTGVGVEFNATLDTMQVISAVDKNRQNAGQRRPRMTPQYKASMAWPGDFIFMIEWACPNQFTGLVLRPRSFALVSVYITVVLGYSYVLFCLYQPIRDWLRRLAICTSQEIDGNFVSDVTWCVEWDVKPYLQLAIDVCDVIGTMTVCHCVAYRIHFVPWKLWAYLMLMWGHVRSAHCSADIDILVHMCYV